MVRPKHKEVRTLGIRTRPLSWFRRQDSAQPVPDFQALDTGYNGCFA